MFEKMKVFYVLISGFCGLFFAEVAGKFIIEQFTFTVTDYWLSFMIGYFFVMAIIKIITEVIAAIVSFFGLFIN